MKSYLFQVLLLLTVYSFSFAQKGTIPPAAVKDAFEKKFTGITQLRWSKEGKKGYEASFTKDKTNMSAVFDARGQLLETETAITMAELPAAAVEYIQAHYKGSKIKETAKITKANAAINYEAEVNGKDLIFDETGKFITSVKD